MERLSRPLDLTRVRLITIRLNKAHAERTPEPSFTGFSDIGSGAPVNAFTVPLLITGRGRNRAINARRRSGVESSKAIARRKTRQVPFSMGSGTTH